MRTPLLIFLCMLLASCSTPTTPDRREETKKEKVTLPASVGPYLHLVMVDSIVVMYADTPEYCHSLASKHLWTHAMACRHESPQGLDFAASAKSPQGKILSIRAATFGWCQRFVNQLE